MLTKFKNKLNSFSLDSDDDELQSELDREQKQVIQIVEDCR